MTSCDYCDRRPLGSGDVVACNGCDASVCVLCSVVTKDGIFCSPDPATWPGRGCYKPPAAEVAG